MLFWSVNVKIFSALAQDILSRTMVYLVINLARASFIAHLYQNYLESTCMLSHSLSVEVQWKRIKQLYSKCNKGI